MSDRLTPEPLPRRDFLGLAGLWAAGIAIFGSLIGMLRLTQPAVLPEQGRRFRIGRPEDLGGGVQMVPEQKVMVVSDTRGIAAISLVCSHLGCIVSQTDSGFSCPCHGSAFDLRGDVLNPPAPRALDLFPVRIENGVVKVDVRRPRRRTAYSPSQVTRS